eukprot:TRINITY_DN12195_c0_g2_i4.p1 TRINITY_DN12195_c0_g2~~TRINITY_DN12195_c0_g2_i4.p1  ORF type:complete len:248 (-),score=21.92 TRINITY_DN12195_c0_g2_i4:22-765(-)
MCIRDRYMGNYKMSSRKKIPCRYMERCRNRPNCGYLHFENESMVDPRAFESGMQYSQSQDRSRSGLWSNENSMVGKSHDVSYDDVDEKQVEHFAETKRDEMLKERIASFGDFAVSDKQTLDSLWDVTSPYFQGELLPPGIDPILLIDQIILNEKNKISFRLFEFLKSNCKEILQQPNEHPTLKTQISKTILTLLKHQRFLYEMSEDHSHVKLQCILGHRGRNYFKICLLYTSPSPRDRQKSRMPSSA